MMRLLWLALPLMLLTLPVAADAQRIAERKTDAVARPDEEPNLSRVTKLIIEQTNEFRKRQGLEPVEPNPKLMETAEYFAEFMARTDKYGHEADGQLPADRAGKHGYEYCIISENIAWQFSSVGFETKELAQRFVTGWKESPGHRKNMLDPDVTETGVAVAHSEESGRYYAVQMFGRPQSKQIEFRVVNESQATVRYELGEQEFPLPPRYSRTHRRCRPTKIAFLKPDGDATQKTFRVDTGDTFVIRSSDQSGYTVIEQSAPSSSQ